MTAGPRSNEEDVPCISALEHPSAFGWFGCGMTLTELQFQAVDCLERQHSFISVATRVPHGAPSVLLELQQFRVILVSTTLTSAISKLVFAIWAGPETRGGL